MKVAIIGPAEVDGRNGPVWDAVRGVLGACSTTDELIHTGGAGVGGMVDSIARRAKGVERRRLPKIAPPQVPEIGRYERVRALELNAAQILHVRAPNVVVYIGYGDDDEVRPLLELAQKEPYASRTNVYTADEFIVARRERGRVNA